VVDMADRLEGLRRNYQPPTRRESTAAGAGAGEGEGRPASERRASRIEPSVSSSLVLSWL
jgi:hypothetical protein